MPRQKSKFPSYGLVRGPSHEQGGVAGMVADEQPVELEGGEWIIPKEVVPDYLPVLQQITNEGRAMQQMENGNSAMDALIASASMQNGLAQPKSPMYQEGGNVLKLRPFDTPSSDEIRQAFKADPLPGSDYKWPFDKEKKYKETGQYWTDEPSIAQLLNWQFSQLPKFGPKKEAEEAYMRGEMRMGSTYKDRKYDVNELYRNAKIRQLLGVKEAAEAMGEDGMQAVMDERLTSSRFMKDILEDRMWKHFNEQDSRAILASRREEIPVDWRAPEYRGPSYSWTGVPSLPEVKVNPLEKLQYYINKALPKKQGGKIEYEDGGKVSIKRKLIDNISESNGLLEGYSREDLETLDLDTLERIQGTMIERNIGDQYGGIEDVLISMPGSADKGVKRTYANRFDVAEEFGPEGRVGTATEQLNLGSLPGLAAISNLASRAGVNPEGAIGRVLNAPLPIQRTADIGTGDVSYALTRRQGGPVDYYQTGGQVQEQQELIDTLMNVGARGFLGDAPPRKQQEMRNPAMYYGPPIELMGPDSSVYNEAQSEFEAFMDSLERKRNTNPFSGKPMDTDADVKRLLERMKKSKIPRSSQRMIMRQGGPIPYQTGGQVNPNSLAGKTIKASDLGLENLGEVKGIPSYSVNRPEFEAAMNYAATDEEAEIIRQESMANFMAMIENEKRVRPLTPDKYVMRNGEMSDRVEMNIPKLTPAYLASYGFNTPISQREGALLRRKAIAPETLNPKVKGLINRALVRRLANEED